MTERPSPGEECEFRVSRGLDSPWRRGTVTHAIPGGKLGIRSASGGIFVLEARLVRKTKGPKRPAARSPASLIPMHLRSVPAPMANVTRGATKTKAPEIPKAPRARSEKYMDFVRGKPCCVCGALPPNDPHHAYGDRGMALKASDYRCVPLCRTHHDEFHQTAKVQPFTGAGTHGFMVDVQVKLLIEWIEAKEAL